MSAPTITPARQELYDPKALVDPETRDEALDAWSAIVEDAMASLDRRSRVYEEALHTRPGAAIALRRGREAADARIHGATVLLCLIQTVRQALGGLEDLHDAEIGRPRV